MKALEFLTLLYKLLIFLYQATTWDFNSCNGCQLCKCSSASLTDDCNVLTGQCECKPGVTGLKCDRCDYGYFGYTEQGCQGMSLCFILIIFLFIFFVFSLYER